MKKKEPIAYILNNIIVIYQVYLASNKKPKDTYEGLKKILPEIENEMEFPSFNSRIKPIIDTYEFLKSDKPVESDKINQLTQEIKRLNSVITTLYNEIESYEVNQVNVESDKPVNEVNQVKVNLVNLDMDKPTNEVNVMINEIMQRLEKVEKAVFQGNINLVNPDMDKPVNQVNVGLDKPTYEVNPIQANTDKLKVGKWNITAKTGKRGNVSYKAFRNFGDKGVIKGVKGVHIGNIFTPEIAIAKITAKGYEID